MEKWLKEVRPSDLFYTGILAYLEKPGNFTVTDFPVTEFRVQDVQRAEEEWGQAIRNIEDTLRNPGSYSREDIRLEALNSLYTTINHTFVNK